MCWVFCLVGGAVASRMRKGAKGDPCIYLGTSHSLKTNFLELPDPQFTHCTPGQHKSLRKQTRSPWGSWRVSDLQVQTLLWECRLKTTPSVFPEPAPGAAGQHAKPTPWEPHLLSRAGDVARQGTRTEGDGAGSMHQRFLPMPVVAMAITDRDRLGLIYQRRIFDLEQKYWSEGGKTAIPEEQACLAHSLTCSWGWRVRGRWFTGTRGGGPALGEGHHGHHGGERDTYRGAFGTSSSRAPEWDMTLLTLWPRPPPALRGSQPCPEMRSEVKAGWESR